MKLRTLALLFALLPPPAAGQGITVTTVQDVVDFPAPQTVSELPGPDGAVSFREAAIAANNTAGPQTLAFAIPQSDWWFVDDMAVLRIEILPVLFTDDATTIDFTTQTLFTGDTNPDGPEVGIYGVHPNWYGTPAIAIHGDACVVSGLGMVWNRISVSIGSGQDNRIVGCMTPSVEIGDTVAPAPHHNVVGGTVPEDGNVLGSVRLSCHSDDNVVIGNTITTVDVVGSQYCVHPSRNRIGGPTPAERNVIVGSSGFGEEGFPIGEAVEVYWARDTLVEGNYIGVTADGMAASSGSPTTGVEVADSIDTTIRGNLIAGIMVEGVDHFEDEFFGKAIYVNAINADNVGVLIEGNMLGTDATGASPIPTLEGVVVASLIANQQSLDVRVGGMLPAQGNLIAFVERNGVSVRAPNVDTEISGNSIHSNGLLGIDLVPGSGLEGVTPNDPGDADKGGNGLQNFPVLGSARAQDGVLRVAGFLSSMPLRSYRIELFGDERCDLSGYGEGRHFLGSVVVTTNASGVARFGAVIAAPPVALGDVLTSTATDLVELATSEFSACIPVGLISVPAR